MLVPSNIILAALFILTLINSLELFILFILPVTNPVTLNITYELISGIVTSPIILFTIFGVIVADIKFKLF